jgi:hypothetical protein
MIEIKSNQLMEFPLFVKTRQLTLQLTVVKSILCLREALPQGVNSLFDYFRGRLD